MKHVVMVIPCGKDKLDHAAAASDLYTGSAFKAALAAALHQVDGDRSKVLILSALHGLVGLDDVLEPYDVKMGDELALDRRDDGLDLLEVQFLCRGLHADGVDIYAMLPKAYFAALDTVARRWFTWIAPVYEACIGIGDQRAVMRCARTF